MSNKVTVAAIQMTYGLPDCCSNCLKTGISARKKAMKITI